MISQRAQTILLACFLALVGAAVVVMFRYMQAAPPPEAPTARTDLDSASQAPSGLLQFQAGPDNTILRILSGSCHAGGPPTIELSADDGFHFRPIRVPQVDDGTGVSAASPAVSVVVALEPRARRQFVVWGADEKCKIRSYITNDAGMSWRQGNLPITEWGVDPKSGIVFSPRGPANLTCDAIRTLSGFDEDRAVATCLDGSVGISEDGETWNYAPDLDDSTTAVVFTSTRRGFSLRKEDRCESRLYATNDGGERWTPRACVLATLSFPALGATSRLLVTGGSGPVWISTDEGETWKRPVKAATEGLGEPTDSGTSKPSLTPTPAEAEKEEEGEEGDE